MEDLTDTRILIPVDATALGEPSPGIIDLFGTHSLVILGIYEVPDQSATDQVRAQFGEEITADIKTLAARFTDRGATVESTVVFTHDRRKSIERVAAEEDVDAVLAAGPLDTELERVLVPLRGDDNLERIVAFLGTLMRESDASVTLFNVADSDEEASRAEFILRGARDRLVEDGIESERIEWTQERDFSPSEGILQAAEAYDLLVVGETEPSLRERLLGDVTNRIVAESPRPVLVVRNP